MRVLIVGGDGRAHALAWCLVRSPSVDEVLSAPGNPGLAALGPTFDVGIDDFVGQADLAADQAVDLTVVSPEAPLVGGICDVFRDRGLAVFGPSKAAAEIEGSKVFCRELALQRGVQVAAGEAFDDPDAAADFARMIAPPMVVKASGLAAGKGVAICPDHEAAVRAINVAMRERVFGDAGNSVIVEEHLSGREISIFAVTDGERKVVIEPAQDYKRALDGDQGLNTGGMGSYTPVPWLSADARRQAVTEIVEPLLDGLAEQGRPYTGCFYAGLMFTEKGPYLIEVNCRFGDPEIQALVRRFDGDLGVLLSSAASGELDASSVSWTDDAAVCVVVASGGYPESYRTGVPVAGIDDAEALDGVVVFQAGTATVDGELVSSGGRVLDVTATGPDIVAARERAYEAASRIRMDGSYRRSDIAAVL